MPHASHFVSRLVIAHVSVLGAPPLPVFLFLFASTIFAGPRHAPCSP